MQFIKPSQLAFGDRIQGQFKALKSNRYGRPVYVIATAEGEVAVNGTEGFSRLLQGLVEGETVTLEYAGTVMGRAAEGGAVRRSHRWMVTRCGNV